MSSHGFNPEDDVPDLSGKVVFVTGGTAGLGAESVVQLAKKNPRAIYFSGRNSKNAESVIERVKATAANAPPLYFVQCDLGSLQSVATAAQHFTNSSDRLDILMCNAGIMAKPPGLTSDGYELQFGTNHIGHALLIKKLLPILQTTAQLPGTDVRTILLTSLGFRGHPCGGIVFKDLKTVQDFGAFGSWTRYGQSKLANILYARELARRYPAITSLSIHPGVVETDLVGSLGTANKMFVYATQFGAKMLTPAQGAHNQLWAASAERSAVVSGQMYEPVGKLFTRFGKTSKDDRLAGELWEWTEKELKAY